MKKLDSIFISFRLAEQVKERFYLRKVVIFNMTIRHLKIFIEVADSKSMSRAASKFYISQPTVSQAIAELESHYGAPLFEI